jgi:hypothetical protein
MSGDNTGSGPDGDGLDEALLAAEIEAEFEDIRAEIDRINIQERVGGPTKRLLLQQYREHKKATRKTDLSRSPARKKLDDAIEAAIDGFVEQGLVEKADGTLALTFNSELIGTHGIPVLTAILDAVRAGLVEQQGRAGAMSFIGPHIIQFIEQFRTSFAGAPPEPVSPDDKVGAAAAAPKAPSMADVFQMFSGLAKAAKTAPPRHGAKGGGAGRHGKGGGGKGKGNARGGGPAGPPVRQTVRFSADPAPAPSGATQGAGRPPEPGAQGAASGPTVRIDFAGLLGSLMQGMSGPKTPGKGAPPEVRPAPEPATEPEPSHDGDGGGEEE